MQALRAAVLTHNLRQEFTMKITPQFCLTLASLVTLSFSGIGFISKEQLVLEDKLIYGSLVPLAAMFLSWAFNSSSPKRSRVFTSLFCSLFISLLSLGMCLQTGEAAFALLTWFGYAVFGTSLATLVLYNEALASEPDVC